MAETTDKTKLWDDAYKQAIDTGADAKQAQGAARNALKKAGWGVVQPAQAQPTQTTPASPATQSFIEPVKAPESISEVVEDKMKTYAEQAESVYKGSYLEAAETFEKILGKPAPFKTEQEFLEWQKRQNTEDLEFLQKQQDYAREIEQLEFQKAKEQVQGAISGTATSMAQGREGAMSGTAPMFVSEFKDEMNRAMRQMEVQRSSAEASREKAMIDLKRAQEAGDLNLAEAIQGKIDGIEQQLRQADSEALRIATLANEQALEQKKFEHAQTIDFQANYRANLGVFTSMVEMGTEMSTDQISSMAQSLNIPFEVANGYYEGAKMIRENKNLDFQSKQIALQDLAYDFDLKLKGIEGERARQVYGITNLLKSGKISMEEAQNLFMGMGIDSSMNPITQINMRISSAQAVMDEYKAKYLGKEPPEGSLEWFDYQSKKYALKAAEYEYNQMFDAIPENMYRDIFFQEGTNRSERSKAGGDNIRECGEGYNDITDGPKVGDDFFTEKMPHAKRKDNPQIGNGLVTSHGGTKYGHMETVLNFNPITETMLVGGWNYYGDGKWSTRSITVDELNAKYGNNWGFTDSKLKDKYIDKTREMTGVAGGALTPQQQTEANALAVKLYGGAVLKSEDGRKAFLQPILDRLAAGESINDISDDLRYKGQSPEFSGTIRNAAQQITSKLSDKQTNTVFDKLDDVMSSGDIVATKDFLKKMAIENAPGGAEEGRNIMSKERTLQFISEIENDLKEFESKGGNTNIFNGTIEQMTNKIGAVKDPELRKIAQKIQIAVQTYRKAVSGAAFTESEAKEYRAIFPDINNVSGLNSSKIKALQETWGGDVDFFYQFQMGSDAYNQIFKTPQGQPSSQYADTFGNYGLAASNENFADYNVNYSNFW